MKTLTVSTVFAPESLKQSILSGTKFIATDETGSSVPARLSDLSEPTLIIITNPRAPNAYIFHKIS